MTSREPASAGDTSAARRKPEQAIKIELYLWRTMSARILDGLKLAAAIKAEVAEEVRQLAVAGMRPGLAAVLVGNDPASEVYVRNKVKTCEELGIYSEKITPDENVTTDEMLALVDDLNRR